MAVGAVDKRAGNGGTLPTLAELRRIGLGAGLDDLAVTSAEVLEPARSVLHRRRAVGLAATMAFTYRNPDRSTDPGRILDGAAALVVGSRRYRRHQPPPPSGLVGRVARYAWDDLYGELRRGLGAVAGTLSAAGYATRVVADANDLVDRNAAWRAGIGWYGKNTNILASDQGSWQVLGAVVTDAPLIADREPVVDGCGPCTACLDHCPTEALVAPGVLDARRCIAWLVQAADPIPLEYRTAVGDRIYGCDICQEVCPPNRETPTGNGDGDDQGVTDGPDGASDQGHEAWVDVRWILEASDEALLDRYGRWYLARRDPDVLRRTALVIVGNTATPGDAVAAELLASYLVVGRSALLRTHALWAARRLGLTGLVASVARDPDPSIQAELAAPVEARTI
jgi:epoxyqueuosine reductase